MTHPSEGSDPRAARTRSDIRAAFVNLLFSRRYEQIQIAEISQAAGVGRSTFYAHFRSKEDVLLEVIDPVLLTVANSITGRVSKAQLRSTLSHLWDQRSTCRAIFVSGARRKIVRRLSQLVQCRMQTKNDAAPPALAASAAASGHITMLHMWTSGEVSCTADALAHEMMLVGSALSRGR